MNKFIKNLDKILMGFSVTTLAVMLAVTTMQVIRRKLFNNPAMWSEELTLFLLVWFGFIVMAIGIRSDSHIAIEYFYDKQSPAAKKILDIIRHLLLFLLAVLMVYYSFQMVKLGWNNKMPATQIRRGYLYASSLIGGLLFAVFSMLNLVKTIRGKGATDAG